MSKLLYVVALIALVAILACGGDEATEAPADTSSQQPTTAPTAMTEPTEMSTSPPEPTTAPDPTDTPEPTEAPATPEATEPETGAIAPLNMNDPVSIAAELSESELACVAGVAEIGELLQLLASPELATPERLGQLINCLEDETLLQYFLAGLVGATGPLSVETSMCIRSGMEGVDLRSVMLAGQAGDEGAAMVGSMSALFLTVSCLNDEEMEAAGPILGMTSEDREGLQCVLQELGGPEGLGEILSAEGEAGFVALFGAAIACGLELEGGPGMTDGPTDLLPPPPGTEQGTETEDPGTMQDNFSRIISQLSIAELTCLAEAGITPEWMQDPSALDSATPEQQVQIIGCFDDETVLNIFLSGLVGDPSQLSEETSTCIQTGLEGVDLRSVMLGGNTGDAEVAMVGSMSAMFLTVSCLNDEEMEAAGPALGMTPEDREGLQCLMQELGGPEGLGEIVSAEDEAGFMALFGAAIGCGVQMEGIGAGG